MLESRALRGDSPTPMNNPNSDTNLSESEIDALLDRALAPVTALRDTGRMWRFDGGELDAMVDARCHCARSVAYFVPGVCGRCHGETVGLVRSQAA